MIHSRRPASGPPGLRRFRARDDKHTLAQEREHALLVFRALPLQRLPETTTVIRTGDDSVPEVQGSAQRPTPWFDIQGRSVHLAPASRRSAERPTPNPA